MSNNNINSETKNDDEILFVDEKSSVKNIDQNTAWKIMIVDDKEEIHNVTRLVLNDVTFKGQNLEFINAYSSEEAIKLISKNPNTALILLDIVMEENNSGLKIIKYIREELKNFLVRIVIRTGQPGEAPEKNVIIDYDINDYREKTELTSTKLFTTVIASLRSYDNLISIDTNRKALEKIIETTANLFKMQEIKIFSLEVLVQITSFLNLNIYKKNTIISGFVASKLKNELLIVSSIGRFNHNNQKKLLKTDLNLILNNIKIMQKKRKYIYSKENKYICILKSKIGNDYILYIETSTVFSKSNKYLIEVLLSSISSIFYNIQLTNEIEDTQKEILYTLGEVVENRHRETSNHVKRVAEYSYLLASKYGLSNDETYLIKQASPMHDVGKVGILDSILNKPGKLTPDEFEIIKTHTTIGYNIFKSSQRRLLKAAAIIALQHHEKYNGTGYPSGLKGGNIHIYGRITCLADVFDALGSDRIYKKAWPQDKIIEYIKSESNKSFDPKLINIFLENLSEILKIKDSLTQK